jgi:hypothetical protein
MKIQVTVYLTGGSPQLPPCGWVADKLVEIRKGRLFSWQPETALVPARAQFVFASEQERGEFLAAVRVIERVSIDLDSEPARRPAAQGREPRLSTELVAPIETP